MPEGERRSPGYAAVLSLFMPGLGQIYNGDVLKGMIALAAFVALVSAAILSALRGLAAASRAVAGPVYGPSFDISSILGSLFDGVGVVWMLLLIGLWVWAVADAALRASRSLTSDDTGLV